MAEMKQIVELLQQQRRALMDQLAAVDRALSALGGKGAPVAAAESIDDPGAESVSDDLRPTHVKARRTQTDAHKHAISAGKRRARHARDAAKGLVREVHDDDFMPAVGRRGDDSAPRLVKRQEKK
ncbi:MAG: hypothetical protein A3F70_07270 [Acidobacteria bacterium RIFCSPLOWO2_12_FULL_67_14]|nr:MAG: hypothetical protein A3H29_11115 [Acidobacteria bacterium RIFCSPLOWO2_02_FULL_67_21]OFW34764.1 MAG: hypothetical protein A3F70_07270 [Acidobacteria bacterium RIFCSPLOWO2_12_FULL_67_14]